MAIVDPKILAQTAGISLTGNPYATNIAPVDISPLIKMQELEIRKQDALRAEQEFAIRQQNLAQQMDFRERQEERISRTQELQNSITIRDELTGLNFLPADRDIRDKYLAPVAEVAKTDPVKASHMLNSALAEPEFHQAINRYKEVEKELQSVRNMRPDISINYGKYEEDLKQAAIEGKPAPNILDYEYYDVRTPLQARLNTFGYKATPSAVTEYISAYYDSDVVRKQLEMQGRDPQAEKQQFISEYVPAMSSMKQYMEPEPKTSNSRTSPAPGKTSSGYDIRNVGAGASGKSHLNQEQLAAISEDMGKGNYTSAIRSLVNYIPTNQDFIEAIIPDIGTNFTLTASTSPSADTAAFGNETKEYLSKPENVNKLKNKRLREVERRVYLVGDLPDELEESGTVYMQLHDPNILLEERVYTPNIENLSVKGRKIVGAIYNAISGESGVETSNIAVKNAGSDLIQSVYDSTYGYSTEGLTKPLTDMTISEVREFQRGQIKRTAAQGVADGQGTSAVGAFQFLGSTLDELIPKTEGVDMNSKFDEETQTKLLVQYLYDRGLQEVLDGKESLSTFMSRVVSSWEGLQKGERGAQTTFKLMEAIQKILDEEDEGETPRTLSPWEQRTLEQITPAPTTEVDTTMTKEEAASLIDQYSK